jgi:hypothetical protein
MVGEIRRGEGMSGLLALLDDVAAIAKVAAASVDDVIGQASKAGRSRSFGRSRRARSSTSS